MYKGDFKSKLRVHLSNIPGFRTRRKILVIESDDWGSTRTFSNEAHGKMLHAGLKVDQMHFDTVDSLESNEDLEQLFELLHSFKDVNGKPAVFTPMCIMGNPDFSKIEEDDFKNYHFQELADTIKDYPEHDRLLDLWNEGKDAGVFKPGIHGREHLNVRRYFELIKNPDSPLRPAFKLKSLGGEFYEKGDIPNYLGALHPESMEEIDEIKAYLLHAGALFESYLGEKPSCFIAPNREEPKSLEPTLKQIGVKYLTRSKIRNYPIGDGTFEREYNWPGKINEHGQLVIVRNCFFEPVTWGEHQYISNWVANCLKEIEIAFRWNKPAVISSHRVNYVGFLQKQNQEKGLKALKLLLTEVQKRWPDVEFMSTKELGQLIEK